MTLVQQNLPTAGASSLIASGIGGIGAAAGSIFAAQSDKIGLNLAARIAEINAESARDNGREALRQGGEQETRLRLSTAQLKSRQIATMAANGVRLDDGSALTTLTSTDYMGEADAATIRQNAAREAAGYRMQAVGYSNEALTKRAQASAISPFLSGLTSLMGSASKVAGRGSEGRYDTEEEAQEAADEANSEPESEAAWEYASENWEQFLEDRSEGTKFEQYTEDGGEDYHELLLTLGPYRSRQAGHGHHPRRRRGYVRRRRGMGLRCCRSRLQGRDDLAGPVRRDGVPARARRAPART